MTQISDRTVLFADLRGSTSLFETLGNAEATSVVTHCVAAITVPVVASGGRVVKTLGDGLMALFDTPAEAVQAAAQMHDVLDAMVSRGNERGASAGLRALRLQVALARGEVVEMSGDAFGDAVNVAARLLDHADDNETFITQDVLAGLPKDQRGRFRSLDRLTLRGRSEPVQVHVQGGRRGSELAATAFGDLGDVPLDGPGGIRLTWMTRTRLYPGTQMPIVLGRSPQANFCVDDSRVSRSHCRVDWHGSGFQLADLSYNGTYVRFADGEVVSLRRGSCTLHGSGSFALGGLPSDPTSASVKFEIVHQTTAAQARRGGKLVRR